MATTNWVTAIGVGVGIGDCEGVGVGFAVGSVMSAVTLQPLEKIKREAKNKVANDREHEVRKLKRMNSRPSTRLNLITFTTFPLIDICSGVALLGRAAGTCPVMNSSEVRNEK